MSRRFTFPKGKSQQTKSFYFEDKSSRKIAEVSEDCDAITITTPDTGDGGRGRGSIRNLFGNGKETKEKPTPKKVEKKPKKRKVAKPRDLVKERSCDCLSHVFLLILTSLIMLPIATQTAYYFGKGTASIFMDTPFILKKVNEKHPPPRPEEKPIPVEEPEEQPEEDEEDNFPPPRPPADYPAPKPQEENPKPPDEIPYPKPPPENPYTKPPLENPSTKPSPENPSIKPPSENPSTKPSPENPSTKPPPENPSTKPPPENPSTKPSPENPSTKPPPENPSTLFPTELPKARSTLPGNPSKRHLSYDSAESQIDDSTLEMGGDDGNNLNGEAYKHSPPPMDAVENDKVAPEDGDDSEVSKDYEDQLRKGAIDDTEHGLDQAPLTDSSSPVNKRRIQKRQAPSSRRQEDEKEEKDPYTALSGDDSDQVQGFVSGGLRIFKPLKDASRIEEFWRFMLNTFMRMLYWDLWSSNEDPERHTPYDDNLPFYSSKLIGVPRMRQVRVAYNTCSIHPSVQHLFEDCYGYYNGWTEDKSSILPSEGIAKTTPAWEYRNSSALWSMSYWGTFGWYGGGGYSLDFSADGLSTLRMLLELESKSWVNRSTRAVFIDFTIYNANVNFFLLCKIVFEFPPAGGMVTHGSFVPLRLFRYVTTFDFVVLGAEVVFILLLLIFIYRTLMRAINDGKKFFNAWNILDIVIIVVSIVIIIMWACRYLLLEKAVEQWVLKKDEHPALDFARFYQLFCDRCGALLLFLLWIKLFRFLRFSQGLSDIHRTFYRSCRILLGFFLLFAIILLAFAQLGFLIFGNEMPEFQTFWMSFVSMLHALYGRFDYGGLYDYHSVIGPLFLFLFSTIAIALFMCMLAAIIIEVYFKVKSEIVPNKNRALDHYKDLFVNVITMGGARRKAEQTKDAEAQATCMDILKALQRAGFTCQEIKIFFGMYKIDVDKDVSRTEIKKLITDLELRRYKFEPAGRGPQASES